MSKTPPYDRMVKRVEIDNKGCWIFTGCKDRFGYGKVGINGSFDRAHRISYRKKHGFIPEDACVLHKCDVPACCNPDHLFLGTRAENNRDKARKCRDNRKLSKSDVLSIKKSEGTHQSIADSFGVSRSMITLILQGKERKFI